MDMARASTVRYNMVAIVLHWLIAGLILFMIGFGYYLTTLKFSDPTSFPLVQLHKSIGLSILVLSMFRLIWWILHPAPPLPNTISPFLKFVAHFTHVLLYALIILIPLSGWALVSASTYGLPTMWFGLFEWPHIPFLAELPFEEKKIAGRNIYSVHATLAYGALALVVLHGLAAIYHHIILKDATLRRILPWTRLIRERQ